jgi:hypothetical protein
MKKLLELADEIRWRDKRASRERYEALRQESRIGSAKAMVLKGRKACFDQGEVSKFFPSALLCPRGSSLRRHIGGLKGCVAKVREGGWEPVNGVWSRDFVHGLKLAGGLRRREDAGSFYIPYPTRRRWLVEEVEAGLPVSCRGVGEVKLSDLLTGYLVRGFYLAEMPPADPCGAGVVAGMLAGSMKVRKADGLWLAMKRSEEAEWVLDRWTIAHQVGKGFTKWNKVILTSPFYAAVFRSRMPEKARLWVEKSVGPVWCPLLPMAMWHMAFDEGGSGMPFPGALPWGRGRMEASRMGIGLKGLKLAVMNTCGVTGVYGGLREEMEGCYRRAKGDISNRLVL